MNRRGFFSRLVGGFAAAIAARHLPKGPAPHVYAPKDYAVTTFKGIPLTYDTYKQYPLLAKLENVEWGRR